MQEDFDTLIKNIASPQPRQFEIYLIIDENGQNPALDITISAMDRILFCGWVARLLSEYIEYIEILNKPPLAFGEKDIPQSVVEEFHLELGRRFRRNLTRKGRYPYGSWIDCYENPDEWYELLRRWYENLKKGPLFSGGKGIASRSDLLRLEIVSLTKINPSVIKILATGVASSMLVLTTTFAAVHLMKEKGAEECRKNYAILAQQQTEIIGRQMKLEGRTTEIHEESLEKIRASLEVGIAACGSSLNSFTLSTNGKDITAKVSGDELRK